LAWATTLPYAKETRQSYGKFNSTPGIGGNITWTPNSNFKLLTNNYYGTDAAGIPDRKRFHSDNSILVRYYNKPKSNGITKMAFSLTGDFGFEKGSGVNGFKDGDSIQGPAQYFASAMFYNRIWFAFASRTCQRTDQSLHGQHTYSFYEKMGMTITANTKAGYGPDLDKYVMTQK
jgi:hypothetical protein